MVQCLYVTTPQQEWFNGDRRLIARMALHADISYYN
jgi:hypothetical protein